MKVAIMQPYFLPYIGYFQLIKAVDRFVIYDNIQYTKKGWINRNRILINGKDEYISLPLKKDSDYLNICDRKLSDSRIEDRIKMVRKIQTAYSKAPLFEPVFALLNNILKTEEDNLFKFIHQSLVLINEYLNIHTQLIISSDLPIDHTLRSQDKVMALCKELHATVYINPIGGVDLYDRSAFAAQNITLKFLQSQDISYSQFTHTFVPWLSIIDVMMFNDVQTIHHFLTSGYTLV